MFPDSLERVRQKAITFKKAEKMWKSNPPKGKKYIGFTFRHFSYGYEAVPVFKKK